MRALSAELLPVAIARARADLALPRATSSAISQAAAMLSTLPTKSDDELDGKIALEAYRIAVDDMPADVIAAAVRSILRDTSRTFRPSPPEFRAACEAVLGLRRARLLRLEREAQRREEAAAEAERAANIATPEQVAEVMREFAERRRAVDDAPVSNPADQA